jgi:hypothetical protein
LIGHPLEKLIVETPSSGALDIKLGRDIFTISVTQAKNSLAESLPYPNLPKEVMSVLPFNSPVSSFEKDAKLFVEEEGDLGETIDLPTEKVPAQPPVELKPLSRWSTFMFFSKWRQKHSYNN